MNTKEILQAIKLAKQNNQKALHIFDATGICLWLFISKRSRRNFSEELALKPQAKAFDKIDTLKGIQF